MFVRQTIDLGGETQRVESGINQFAGSQTADRIVITLGKFSVADIFDTNKFAHDPRTDFMNWALVNPEHSTMRRMRGDIPTAPRPSGIGRLDVALRRVRSVGRSEQRELDPPFKQFQSVVELEHRHQIAGQPGKIAVTGFLTRGRMGRFDDAIKLVAS